VPSEPQLPTAKIWYRRLLRLYPKAYHQRFGAEAAQLFDDLYNDLQRAGTAHPNRELARLYLDTLLWIGKEQYTSLLNRLKKDSHNMNSSQPSFIRRHRRSLLVASVVLILATLSYLSGIWTNSGPWAYAKRIIAGGLEIEKFAGSWNSGWDDVTAFFVSDFVMAHYYGNARTDVGVNSRHALKRSYVSDGKTYTQSLEENLNTHYAHKDSGFDPLTCSTQPPTSVAYIHLPSSGMGRASMVAVFGYNNQPASNYVLYDLLLDQTKSHHGDWKVANVTCLSLSVQTPRPYTTSLEALQADNYNKLPENVKQQQLPTQPAPYDQRHNRSFGPAQN
jgi:hypothetical protein